MTAATAAKSHSNDDRLLLGFLAALALHVVIGVLLVFGLPRTQTTVTPQLAIKGVMIDNTEKRIKREKAEAEQRAREQAELEQKERERLEAEQREKVQEEKRQDEKRAEEKRIEDKRAEDKRQQQLTADKKRKAEADRQAAVKKKADDDKKRAADIKTKQAEKLKAERDAKEQAQREAELKRQLADEEGRMQAENSGLLSQYAALIQQRVVRNWNKPASARAGIQCEVKVTQTPAGVVLSVQIDKCNGDAAVRQSIEAAVYRASPLPAPPDPRLFQRVLVFLFNPTD